MENTPETALSALESADTRVPEADLLRRTVDAGLRGRIARLETSLGHEETYFHVKPFQPTGPLVQWLMTCRDQVASVRDMAEHFGIPECAVKDALKRLLRVNRVAEIHPTLWHLE